MNILAIDPGSTESGVVLYEPAEDRPGRVWRHGKYPNEELLEWLRDPTQRADLVVLEMMSPRGLPVSRQEMETLYWLGCFAEACRPVPHERITREDVKRHFLGGYRPKGGPSPDTRIRAVLIDRFGGIGGKAVAIGNKANPGPLYRVVDDEWQALALAVAWVEGAR